MKKFLLLLTISIAIYSCSNYQLLNSSVYNPQKLAMIKNYRIAKPHADQLAPNMNMTDYQNIAMAIRQQLNNRGLVEDSTSVNLVNFGLTIKTSVVTQANYPPMAPPPPYWYGFGGWSSYWMYPRYTYLPAYYNNVQLVSEVQKNGVLTIDIVDLQDHSYLWSASVENLINNTDQRILPYSEVQPLVSTAFSEFPILPPKTNTKSQHRP